MAGFRIKGITDDTDTCECCGTRLKRAVALMPLDADGNEEGDVTYYGSSCAARALGGRWTGTKVTQHARAAQAKWEQEAECAREWLAIYGPVEHATPREKALLYFQRNPGQLDRPGLGDLLEEAERGVAKLLASARSILAGRP